MLKAFLQDERGQGLVEYALIVALISLAALGVLSQLGGKVDSTLSGAVNSLS